MHHIHCIARNHYSGALLDDKVYGTVFIFPCILKSENKKFHFDYIDNEAGKGMLLQLGQLTIIAILNDACAGFTRYISRFQKISGPLTEFQARQVFADLLFVNLHLQERPVFKSEFREYGYVITAAIPQTVTVIDKDSQGPTEGGLLRFYVDKILNKGVENREHILQEIAERKRNYLWNDEDEFINFNK